MTEQINKSRNAVYVRRHPRGPAKTSARSIKRRQREADVLKCRLNGHSYAAIGKQMNISPSTACDYAMRALRRVVPVEAAQHVLKMELARLDTLEAGLFNSAADGDIAAVDACLRISNQRCRLLGLYPSDKNGSSPSVNLNIGGPDPDSAEALGIQVTFVQPTRDWDKEGAERALNGKLLDLPALDHSDFKPTGQSS